MGPVYRHLLASDPVVVAIQPRRVSRFPSTNRRGTRCALPRALCESEVPP